MVIEHVAGSRTCGGACKHAVMLASVRGGVSRRRVDAGRRLDSRGGGRHVGLRRAINCAGCAGRAVSAAARDDDVRLL